MGVLGRIIHWSKLKLTINLDLMTIFCCVMKSKVSLSDQRISLLPYPKDGTSENSSS